MYQTRANNQSTQPPTYEAASDVSFTQAPVTEPDIDPDFFSGQESHTTPDMFILPCRKTNFLFSTIHDSKRQIFTDQTGRKFLHVGAFR